MNGEYGNLTAKPVKKVRAKTDTKIGTKWTPAEDELLTSLYGHYPDDAVKRNLNHRTWGGIVSRAKRLKLKSRKRVLRERLIAKIDADRAKKSRELIGVEINKLRKRIDKLPYVPREAQEAIKQLYDRHQTKGTVTLFDVSACKEALDRISPKTWAEKLEVETAVKTVRRNAYPGPWQDKVVTKPPLRDPLTLPYAPSQIIQKLHDDLASRGVTMPDIDTPHTNSKIDIPDAWRVKYSTPRETPIKRDILPCLLAGTRVYLCGAMDRVPDGGVMWRKRLTPRLKELGVVLFDPTEKPFYDNKGDESDRKMREEWLQNGEYDKLHEFVKEFRGGDLRMVNNCDFVIIYVDVNSHMCGSYEEIAIANHEKKPILVVCEQGKRGTPQWLFGMLPPEHIFSNFDELMTYLQRIDVVGLDDESGRWYFYRQEVLFPEHVLARLKHRSV